jgi:hypothetical protein
MTSKDIKKSNFKTLKNLINKHLEHYVYTEQILDNNMVDKFISIYHNSEFKSDETRAIQIFKILYLKLESKYN